MQSIHAEQHDRRPGIKVQSCSLKLASGLMKSADRLLGSECTVGTHWGMLDGTCLRTQMQTT